MKPLIQTVMIPLPEELGEEILCNVEYHMENDGIGPYEYWGAKYFDAGEDYIVIDEIKPVWNDQGIQLMADILDYIEKNFDYLSAEAEMSFTFGGKPHYED